MCKCKLDSSHSITTSLASGAKYMNPRGTSLLLLLLQAGSLCDTRNTAASKSARQASIQQIPAVSITPSYTQLEQTCCVGILSAVMLLSVWTGRGLTGAGGRLVWNLHYSLWMRPLRARRWWKTGRIERRMACSVSPLQLNYNSIISFFFFSCIRVPYCAHASQLMFVTEAEKLGMINAELHLAM